MVGPKSHTHGASALVSSSAGKDPSPVTPVSTLCAEARETARCLLTHYVKVQGLVISQMLRKSVETRDWLSTLEPRNVRAVMKRVVEDTTAIDVQVPCCSLGLGWGCGWHLGPDSPQSQAVESLCVGSADGLGASSGSTKPRTSNR